MSTSAVQTAKPETTVDMYGGELDMGEVLLKLLQLTSEQILLLQELVKREDPPLMLVDEHCHFQSPNAQSWESLDAFLSHPQDEHLEHLK